MKVHNCTVNKSKSVGDGGIAVIFNTVLKVLQSNFSDNVAEGFGGVVRALKYSTVTISSSFRHNRAYYEGTMYIDGNSTVHLDNSMFFNSTATNYRGVFCLQLVYIVIIDTIQNSTCSKIWGCYLCHDELNYYH